MSQREVILNVTWNGVVAVGGHALAELVQASGMSHEESLAWAYEHVRTVQQPDVHPGFAGSPRTVAEPPAPQG